MDNISNSTASQPLYTCFDGLDNNPHNQYVGLCLTMFWLRRVISVISILCSLLMFLMIILFKKYRVFSQRLIMYLSISAFFQPIPYIFADYQVSGNDGSFCIFIAFVTQYLDWVAVLWVCCLTFVIFVQVVFYKSAKKLEIPFIIFCWGFPIIVSVIPFFDNAYGLAGLWCWIQSSRINNGTLEHYPGGVAMQMVLYYVPFEVASIGIIVVSIVLIIILHKRARSYKTGYKVDHNEIMQNKKHLQKEARSLYFYPWVLAILFFIPFINRIRQAAGATDGDPDGDGQLTVPIGVSFFLWLLHASSLPLLGTVYTVIFALDKDTRSRLTWANIKSALLCQNTSKVAQPYFVENKVYKETADVNLRISDQSDNTTTEQ